MCIRDRSKVEKEVDEELARFIENGPEPQELQRVKTEYAAAFIRGVDRIGGFGGKSDVLAHGQAFLDDPGFYKVQLQRVQDASVQDLKSAARRWLSDGVYILEVHPFPGYKTVSYTHLNPPQKPPAKPAAKPTQKPKKDTGKEKDKEKSN